MRHKIFSAWVGTVVAVVMLVTAAPTQPQTNEAASGSSATFTVTAVGKKVSAPPIAKDDVQLLQGKERKQIVDWKKGEQLFLAVLIDDSIDTTAGGQWDYLKDFITSQPSSTYIALGYMANNTVRVAQDFTQDHSLVNKAIRLPMGMVALGGSPYLSMLDMLKRWPNSGPRRSIIVITSGIDWFRGPGFGAFYPDVDPLIQRAEKQNTNVWSIYFPSSGHRAHSFFLTNYAQNNIDKVSEETGAESYFLFSAPVSIKPYLDEIGTHLQNQYLLTFAGDGGKKGKFVRMNVKTELPDVEFFTPQNVWLPPSQ